jgi:hypothetical protein
LIDYRPLRPCRQIVLERFNAVRRSFSKRFHASIRTVAHVANNLMPSGSALRKETVTHALHVASYQKLSRYSQLQPPVAPYLHLNNSASLPFSSVKFSVSSEPATFNVNDIVLPLIVPE